MVSIYKKLPLDIQENIDRKLFESNKVNIPEVELIHNRLQLNLLETIPELCSCEKKLIQFVVQHCIKPNIYGYGFCGAQTKSGKYEYIKDKKQKLYLGQYINMWIKYIEKKRKKPNFEKLSSEVRLAMDNWVLEYITDIKSFEFYAKLLKFSVIEMFEFYYDNTGQNPFEDINDSMPRVFCLYFTDLFEIIIMKTYNFELESDTSDLEDFLESDSEEENAFGDESDHEPEPDN
jgi:hypothetical protein